MVWATKKLARQSVPDCGRSVPVVMAFDEVCPLCSSGGTYFFHRDTSSRHSNREYWRCRICALVFVPSGFHLARDAEKAQYDLHQNNPSDEGYRRFLNRLCDPLAARLEFGSRGLDFGSGPGPTLSVMLEERGHAMALYDPFYAPDSKVLAQQYDFVTCTEVVEHFACPAMEFATLWRLVKPGGWLGIMTKLMGECSDFAAWHYKNDPTHIVFYSRKTFFWLAGQWQSSPEFLGADVVLMRKMQ